MEGSDSEGSSFDIDEEEVATAVIAALTPGKVRISTHVYILTLTAELS